MFQQEKINHCSEDTDRFKGFISALAVVHSGGRSTDCPVCEAHSFLLMCVQVLKALLLDTFRSNKAVETCVHSSCPYVVKISDQSLMIGPKVRQIQGGTQVTSQGPEDGCFVFC